MKPLAGKCISLPACKIQNRDPRAKLFFIAQIFGSKFIKNILGVFKDVLKIATAEQQPLQANTHNTFYRSCVFLMFTF